jgi:hypothetical protein
LPIRNLLYVLQILSGHLLRRDLNNDTVGLVKPKLAFVESKEGGVDAELAGAVVPDTYAVARRNFEQQVRTSCKARNACSRAAGSSDVRELSDFSFFFGSGGVRLRKHERHKMFED